MDVNTVEIISIVVYLAAMMVVGIVIAKKIKGSDDYLAGGRKMPLWLVTATLFATWWCGGTVLGGSGAAYHDGFHGVIYDPYGAGLTLVLAGLLLMKIVHDAKVNTLAQFFSCRYGNWAARYSGIVMVPTYALFSAVQVVAIGKIFEVILGWDYNLSIIIGALIILAYTILGGILAVAWTDVFQISLVLIGLVIIFPLAIKLAGGWKEVVAATPPTHFDFFPSKGAGLGDWLWWWGALLGVGLGTMAGPDLYQRAIVAKTGKTAAIASVTSGVGYWLLGLIPVYMGFIGITLVGKGVLDANLINEDSEKIILLIARIVLHPVPAGIFVASLIAAVMSSGDSAIFATAAVMSNDLVKPIYEKSTKKALSDKGLITATRLCVVAFTLLSLLIGLNYPVMYDLLVIGFQLLFHMLFFPLILGVYWKRANATGAIFGMSTGFIIALVWLIASGTFYPEPEWLWTLAPGILSGLVMVVVSLATAKKDPPKPLTATDGTILKFADLAK